MKNFYYQPAETRLYFKTQPHPLRTF